MFVRFFDVMFVEQDPQRGCPAIGCGIRGAKKPMNQQEKMSSVLPCRISIFPLPNHTNLPRSIKKDVDWC